MSGRARFAGERCSAFPAELRSLAVLVGRRPRTSSLELPCDFGSADRGADREEQPVRLAELALACCVVTAQLCQLGALDVEEGLIALRARHLEPGVGFGERVLDLSRRLDALRSESCER